MEFGHTHLLIMFTVICVVSSDTQNLELTDKIDELEIIVFGKNPCQNCMVQLQVKYLELVLKKTLGQNSACQSVNWPSNFAFSLASAVTNFGFNVAVAVAVFGIWYTNKVNRKFKIWEELEELKFLRKSERMQFPPTVNYEMGMLPEDGKFILLVISILFCMKALCNLIRKKLKILILLIL